MMLVLFQIGVIIFLFVIFPIIIEYRNEHNRNKEELKKLKEQNRVGEVAAARKELELTASITRLRNLESTNEMLRKDLRLNSERYQLLQQNFQEIREDYADARRRLELLGYKTRKQIRKGITSVESEMESNELTEWIESIKEERTNVGAV